MFARLGLSAKLYLGFALVLSLFLGLAVFLQSRLQSVKVLEKEINFDCIPGMTTIGQAESQIRAGFGLVLELVNARSDAERAGVESEILKIKEGITATFAAYEKTITQPVDREMFDNLLPIRARYLEAREKVLALGRAGKREEAVGAYLASLRPAFDEFITATQVMSKWNADNAARAGNNIKSAVAASTKALWAGLALAALLAASVGILLSRSIAGALNRMIEALTSGSDQISSASGQVSQSSQNLAEGASEQASSLEETSASLEELSAMTRRNNDNARQADAMANDARRDAEGSKQAMGRMGTAIGKIKGSADETAKIIKTIDEIAFQTNLLALNAAVEAARAGDAGKGFAVVAEEVRNLARRSAEAAKSTSSLIAESQKNADEGVKVSGEVADILTGIVGKVQKLAQLIGEVSSASEEQTKGIEQIGNAVTQMDKVTQSNAASAEESASASEELFAQAKELGDMVGTLVGIVKGSSADPGAGTLAAHATRKAASRPAPAYRAVPAHKTRSIPKPSKAPAAVPGADWSPRPLAKATVEQTIPLTDDEMKDF
jgi:methyl-accepting chemotaxis protein